MSANDIQIGGQHYRGEDIQHWDWAKNMPYLEARCTAYIARHRDKNGIEDIKKSPALHTKDTGGAVRCHPDVVPE
jgi:hypothetical protein